MNNSEKKPLIKLSRAALKRMAVQSYNPTEKEKCQRQHQDECGVCRTDGTFVPCA